MCVSQVSKKQHRSDHNKTPELTCSCVSMTSMDVFNCTPHLSLSSTFKNAIYTIQLNVTTLYRCLSQFILFVTIYYDCLLGPSLKYCNFAACFVLSLI